VHITIKEEKRKSGRGMMGIHDAMADKGVEEE
jgi:hypothetical protein